MSSSLPTLQLTPIGIVHSPWREKHSAPRQPSEARGVAGQIELRPGGQFEHALCDLDEWSHIWVLFWFHLNQSWHAKVLPPRSEKKRGVFATRSPHRPNPIGLSVVRLERVEGRTLHVLDLDILDQTPVFDIKPYVAYSDAPEGANAGWLDPERAQDQGPRYEVRLAERAQRQLAWLGPRLDFDLQALAEAVLRAGPAPHPYRRIRREGAGFRLAVKDFRLRFSVVDSVISIDDIVSGYRRRVLADSSASATDSTSLAVHRDFEREFRDPNAQ
jgi:tRNA-Thr(GGU) m(6)t(6)A37 methyltransferase TsaA